jgi:hypothetical protein
LDKSRCFERYPIGDGYHRYDAAALLGFATMTLHDHH